MKKSLVFIWWLKSLAYICTQETKQKQNERNTKHQQHN